MNSRNKLVNVKHAYIRFDMDNPREKRAWELIKQLKKEEPKKGYDEIFANAIIGFYGDLTVREKTVVDRLKKIENSIDEVVSGRSAL